MDLLDHVLRRMGRHATTLLPLSLLIGIVFQDLAAAARPLVGPPVTRCAGRLIRPRRRFKWSHGIEQTADGSVA